MNAPCGVFEYHRVEHPEDAPAADPRAIDVAVLDMNHGWPNLGHDSLVHLVQDASCDLEGALETAGLRLRVLSFDVRRKGGLPEAPGGRFALYLGTGGPGHIDPHKNDGQGEGTQGILEDARWEAPFFALLDAIRAHDEAALLAVCHTFGVMCRWSRIAEVSLRGAEKGGKSTGLLENLLTAEARRHPWFARFAADLPDGWRLRIADNRLYDLLPVAALPAALLVVGNETQGLGGARGDALTMVEWARDAQGVMPRVFAVNHHPEIVDRARQLLILNRKFTRGEVERSWYEERLEILTRNYPYEDSEGLLQLTSDYTIVAPLRFHLFRAVRRRGEALGLALGVHEDQVLEQHRPAALAART